MKWIEKFWSDELSEIALKTQEKLVSVFWANDAELTISRKADNSLVTEIDHFVSDLVKSKVVKHGGNDVCFFSEEDYLELRYPAVILDPIDGTSQIARGQADCCISLAIMNSSKIDDEKNLAWIFNPFTSFESKSDDKTVKAKNETDPPLLGLISKNDFKRGVFKDLKLSSNVILYPKGSIALKLALLAEGGADFVLSRTPKNIWDIAAGTITLSNRGYKMYNKSGEVTSLESDVIEGPLLWCKPAHRLELSQLLEV